MPRGAVEVGFAGAKLPNLTGSSNRARSSAVRTHSHTTLGSEGVLHYPQLVEMKIHSQEPLTALQEIQSKASDHDRIIWGQHTSLVAHVLAATSGKLRRWSGRPERQQKSILWLLTGTAVSADSCVPTMVYGRRHRSASHNFTTHVAVFSTTGSGSSCMVRDMSHVRKLPNAQANNAIKAPRGRVLEQDRQQLAHEYRSSHRGRTNTSSVFDL